MSNLNINMLNINDKFMTGFIYKQILVRNVDNIYIDGIHVIGWVNYKFKPEILYEYEFHIYRHVLTDIEQHPGEKFKQLFLISE